MQRTLPRPEGKELGLELEVKRHFIDAPILRVKPAHIICNFVRAVDPPHYGPLFWRFFIFSRREAPFANPKVLRHDSSPSV